MKQCNFSIFKKEMKRENKEMITKKPGPVLRGMILRKNVTEATGEDVA